MAVIKTVEVKVEPRIRTVEAAGGLPGPAGEDGADGVSITGASINGSGHLILTFSSGPPVDVGLVVGTDGTDGTDGVDGRSVTGAAIDGSGHLIFTFSSAPSPVDVGDVTGADGVSIIGATVNGSYHLILDMSSGPDIDAGYVRGPAGADGTDGIMASIVAGTGITVDATDPANPIVSATATGTGDVVGPASAVNNRLAVYDGTTGKLIKDGGVTVADLATAAQGALADSAVQPGDLGTAAALDVGTAAGNVPVLDGSGLLDTAVLPALAISDVFVVASQAAMLALTAQRGDVAIRTDINTSFILSTNSPGTLADWKELLTPLDGIVSVAGLTTPTITDTALRTALGLNTGDSPQFASIQLGHASDTTISRVSAGVIAVEGSNILLASGIGSITQAYSAVLDALAAGVSLSTGVFTVTATSSNPSAIRLAEDTDNGTNYVELKAPAALTGNVSFELPSTDGNAGDVMTTDGAGNLSLQPASASASGGLASAYKYEGFFG